MDMIIATSEPIKELATATTNIAFGGGDDWKTLYSPSRTHLGSVNVKIAGLRCRPRRRRKAVEPRSGAAGFG